MAKMSSLMPFSNSSGLMSSAGADSGHANGVRAYALGGFQMLGMHQKAHEIVTVQVQAEQDAAAHVVNAAVHRPVHGLGVVGVVGFGPVG